MINYVRISNAGTVVREESGRLGSHQLTSDGSVVLSDWSSLSPARIGIDKMFSGTGRGQVPYGVNPLGQRCRGRG